MLSLEHLATRLYLPRKPTLTETSLSDKDYCELSTKYKACHVKIMVFWVAKKTQEVADSNPQDSRWNYRISWEDTTEKIVPMQTLLQHQKRVYFQGMNIRVTLQRTLNLRILFYKSLQLVATACRRW